MADRITTLAHDGLRFDVTDEGPIDGEPVLLFHGFPERSSCWRFVRPILHDAGYRTIAMDQRGYSPGARPRRRRDYTMGALLGDALALVDAVAPDGRVHLVGHDWGAIPSWLLAIHHPDRVASLTAVSVPHPAAFLTAMVRSPQVLHSWYMLAFQLPFLPERVLRHGALAGRMVGAFGMTEEDAERFRTEIVEYGALPTALNWYRALPFGDPRLVRGKVAAPTTMVWSDGDAAVEGWGPENSDRWVDGPFRYVALEGVSHWIPTHAADALAEAVLEQLGAASTRALSS